MADISYNISLGKWAYYGSLPAANDALIALPIETTGIVSDATMKDYDTFDAIIAGASNEQTTMGRKTLAAVTVTVDDTNDRVDIDCNDVVWTAAAGNAISAIVIGYDADTTSGADTDITPMSKHDFVATPAGGDITAVIASGGFLRIS